MMDFQRVNHFPRSYELTRKDRLAKNCERMAQNKSAKMFDFIPRSFMMPSEYQDFCQHAARDKGPWIGTGEFITGSKYELQINYLLQQSNKTKTRKQLNCRIAEKSFWDFKFP